MRRRLRLCWTLLALLSTLALAPPALGAGAAVEIDSVPGQIYDVDAGRILFKQSGTAFGIKDRGSQTTTSIGAPAGFEPRGGFLTSHGAMLASEKSSGGGNVTELRDGTPVDLGSLDSAKSLVVAGGFAIWSDAQKLIRRDLALGTDAQVATNALSSGNDVAANGDVAYGTTTNEIRRYRGPLMDELLGAGAQERPEELPLTDGTNVVWLERSPHCCGAEPSGVLHAHGASGEFDLGQTDRASVPRRGADYRVAGGWIAFTRGTADAAEVWLRDPMGNTTKVAGAGANRLVALAPNGELVYATTAFGADGFVLARPGQGSTPVAMTVAGAGPDGERGYDDHALFLDGRWYGVVGGSLRRLVPDPVADGERTDITAAPGPGDTPSHVSVSFQSTQGDTQFECKLDQGAYQSCASPVEYSSLQRGPHTVAVRAVIAGSPSSVETVPAVATWTVEAEPPAVTLASGPSGPTLDATPTFGGAAGDDPEDSSEVTLRIYAANAASPVGIPLRTIVATRTGGTWSAGVTPPLGDGEYVAQATQTDAAGNVGTTGSRAFRVDTAPPTARLVPAPLPVLTGRSVTFDAGGSTDDESALTRYEWDLDGDGDFERDTGSDSTTSRTYALPRELSPAVRVSDAAGNTDVKRIDLTVAPAPPPGLPGVTINDGERFTNDPNVFITPVWPPGATHIFLSNDGGFGQAVKSPLDTSIPWRLDSSGPERLPKTIYARFRADGNTFQDDIILDETRPALTLAVITAVDPRVSAAATRERTYHLHLRARDRTAGVSRMQITTNRARPGEARRFRNRPAFRASTSKIYVRVRDRAGNWSRWKRCGTELATS